MENLILSSFLLFFGTSLGSFLGLFFKLDVKIALSFSGSVMLVASFTSLILPAIETGGYLSTVLGIIFGFLVIALIENIFPHEHIIKGFEGRKTRINIGKVLLIVIGIIIHNIPEGLSVGISLAHSEEKGLITAIAISIQDFPEGLIVTLPMVAVSGSYLFPLVWGVLSGLIESLFCLLGFFTFELSKNLLPFGLGFGGGAMIYITVKEVFPEAFKEADIKTTVSFLIGFLIALYLDTFFG